MERQTGAGAGQNFGVFGPSVEEAEKSALLEQRAINAVHELGGKMPSETATMTDENSLRRLEAIRAKLSQCRPQELIDELLSINSALTFEVIQLRHKADELVKEIFKLTWNKANETTGLSNFARVNS